MKRAFLFIAIGLASFMITATSLPIVAFDEDLGYVPAEKGKAEIMEEMERDFWEDMGATADDGSAPIQTLAYGNDVTELANADARPMYTHGVIDGSYYRIVNVKTGKYLTLENGSTSAGTRLTTGAYSTSYSQQFLVTYMGMNQYSITPRSATTMRIDVSSTGTMQIASDDRSTDQRFQMTPISSDTFRIFTKESGYTDALSVQSKKRWTFWPFAHTHDDLSYVITETVSGMEADTLAFAEWDLVIVSRSYYDMGDKFYIQSQSSGRYLSISGTTTGPTYVRSLEFTGEENQIWKLTQHGGINIFRISPMHCTDLGFEASNATYLKVSASDTALHDFSRIQVGYESGGFLYLIQSSDGKYLKESGSYVLWTTDLTLATVWKFAMEAFNDPEIKSIEYLEDPTNATLVSQKTETGSFVAYDDFDILVFRPTTTKVYQFTMQRSHDNLVFCVMSQLDRVIDTDKYDTNLINAVGYEILDVKLTAGVTYYVYAYGNDVPGTYSLTVTDDYINSNINLRYEQGNFKLYGENDIAEIIWGDSLVQSLKDAHADPDVSLSYKIGKLKKVLDSTKSLVAFYTDTNLLNSNSFLDASIAYDVYGMSTTNINYFRQINYAAIETLENDSNSVINYDPNPNNPATKPRNAYSFPSYARSFGGSSSPNLGMSNECPTAAGASILGFYDRWYPDLISNFVAYDASAGFYIDRLTGGTPGVDINNPQIDAVLLDLYSRMMINEWVETFIVQALKFIYENKLSLKLLDLTDDYLAIIDGVYALYHAYLNQPIGGGFPWLASYGLCTYVVSKGYGIRKTSIDLWAYRGNPQGVFNSVKGFIDQGIPLMITVFNTWTLSGFDSQNNVINYTQHQGIASGHTMTIIGYKQVLGSTPSLWYKVANSWGGYSYLRADQAWISDITAIEIVGAS